MSYRARYNAGAESTRRQFRMSKRFGSSSGTFTKRKRFTYAQKGKALTSSRVGGYYGRFANGGELKFHDVDVDQAAADLSAGVIQNAGTLNIIAQGTTESERVGRKCIIKSIMWRSNIRQAGLSNANSVQGSDTWRIIIYLDKQCNGATAAVTDILETADYQSFRNLSNVGRFQTLMDLTFIIHPSPCAGDSATNDQGRNEVNKSFYKKCDIKLEYDNSATTGALTSIRSNNIGMLIISKGVESVISLDSKIRMRFSDA